MRRPNTVICSYAHDFWQVCIGLQELSAEFQFWSHSKAEPSKKKPRVCPEKPAAEGGEERSLLQKWLDRDACCRGKPAEERSLLEKWLQRDACRRSGGKEHPAVDRSGGKEHSAVDVAVETIATPQQSQEAMFSPNP